jgi:hypothetical protein
MMVSLISKFAKRAFDHWLYGLFNPDHEFFDAL